MAVTKNSNGIPSMAEAYANVMDWKQFQEMMLLYISISEFEDLKFRVKKSIVHIA